MIHVIKNPGHGVSIRRYKDGFFMGSILVEDDELYDFYMQLRDVAETKARDEWARALTTRPGDDIINQPPTGR